MWPALFLNPSSTKLSLTGAGDTGLKREVGLLRLLFVSVGSIIGSGWLLGALGASEIAGPAAIIAWVIAGVMMILLALIHAEMGGMYPVAGGTARFPHYAYGSTGWFAAGWFAWLASVTLAPIETEAALRYASNYAPWLTHKVGTDALLTAPGYGVAAGFLAVFTVINVMGIRRFRDTNTTAVFWKIAVPVLTLATLLFVAFHGSNFSAGGGGFAPTGMKGVFNAISTGGVIFALIGFEQAIALGGESRNPQRNIPVAVIGSVLIGVLLYVGLEMAFVGAVSPGSVSHGWTHISFPGIFGPFAGLANGNGLGWLAILLYIDAIISPAATGLTYTATSARISYALGRNGYVPTAFANVSDRGVPLFSILFSFVVGMLLFLPFPSWQRLVALVTSATALTYGTAPLALGALRRQDPDRERPFRLARAELLVPVGFIFANLIIYWGGWNTDWKLFAAVGIGFVLLAISYLTKANPERPSLDWRAAIWIWPYLGGMAAMSLAINFVAIAVRLSPERV